jgi:hypothetical protein
MSKIRLTQPGFEHYTGQMGVLVFEDGLSTSDVSENDARRMGAVMRCEWENTGADPGNAQRLLDNLNTPAPVFVADGQGTDHDSEAALTASKVQEVERIEDIPKTSETKWSQEQLEAIADKDGIKGLRAIAEPLGIKGTSIRELIREILAGHQLPRG